MDEIDKIVAEQAGQAIREHIAQRPASYMTALAVGVAVEQAIWEALEQRRRRLMQQCRSANAGISKAPVTLPPIPWDTPEAQYRKLYAMSEQIGEARNNNPLTGGIIKKIITDSGIDSSLGNKTGSENGMKDRPVTDSSYSEAKRLETDTPQPDLRHPFLKLG